MNRHQPHAPKLKPELELDKSTCPVHFPVPDCAYPLFTSTNVAQHLSVRFVRGRVRERPVVAHAIAPCRRSISDSAVVGRANRSDLIAVNAVSESPEES
jgi:hypothetical protein